VYLQQVMVQRCQVIRRRRDLGNPCGQRLDAEEGIPAASFGRVRMLRDGGMEGWRDGGRAKARGVLLW
jgi:hypothetical protein